VLAGGAEVLQRLADPALGFPKRIDVGGVDEVHARRQRAAHYGVHLVLAQAPDGLPDAGVRIAAERHRPEADLGDEQAGAAELVVLHACFAVLRIATWSAIAGAAAVTAAL